MFDEKFWLAASFGFFVGLIVKFIWPKISGLLSEKTRKIADEILEAKRSKEAAQALLSKSQEILSQAKKEAELIIAVAESEVQKITEAAQIQLQKEIERNTEIAKARIKTEEEHAIRSLKGQIISKAVEKFYEQLNLNDEQHKKIIAKSLETIR